MGRRTLWTCFGTLLAISVCTQSLTPLYPAVARDLRVDAGVFGAILGGAFLMAVLLQLPLGVAGDRVGRRPFLAAGVVVMAAAQVLRWHAGSVGEFAVGQGLAGVGMACVVVAAFASVADAYPTDRPQAIGLTNSAFNLGQVAGFLFAGVFGPIVGWRWIAISTGVIPLLMLAPIVLMPEAPAPRRQGPPVDDLVITLRYLTGPGVLRFSLMAASVLAVGQGAVYLLPFALHARGLGPQVTALLLLPYALGSIVGAPISGRYADRIGHRRLTWGWLVLGFLAAAVYPYVQWSDLLTGGCLAVIGAAVNSILAMIAVQVIGTGLAVGQVGTGTRLAGLRVGQSLGPSLGPAVAGAAFTHGGLPVAGAALAASMIAGLLLYPRTAAEHGDG